MVVIDEEDACTPPKKKHKKEHKHKHKKHSAEKTEKTKKHKKHKKHKHKDEGHKSPVVPAPATNKSERFTPESTPKREKKVTNGQVVASVPVATTEPKAVPKTDETVKFVSRGLSSAHTLEVISSESEAEQEAECDSDAIDVSVIEADMDLEELMKQKELLQAEIAKAEMDATSSPVMIVDGKKNGSKVTKVEDEVILLDDSSEGEMEVKQKRVRRSKSRERRVVISGREYGARNEVKRYNRSRSKERGYREVERQKHERVHNKEVGR